MPRTKEEERQKIENGETIREMILIKGARSNNLKNISVQIPKNKLVVVTGLSGSGKSSLVMDTLYSEGQRRYVESLSSYARQFLNRMKKPDVDYIKGICPAIAVEQKVSTRNARSTVGSLTEIYDYLRLLFARIGKTRSPVSGEEVKKHSVSDIVDYIYSLVEGTKVQLFAPLHEKSYDRTIGRELSLLLQKGYTRVKYKDAITYIEDLLGEAPEILNISLSDHNHDEISILIDRFAVHAEDEDAKKRVADSVQTCMYEGEGTCHVEIPGNSREIFNTRFELDGMEFIEPVPALFNYNNPLGACPRCEGFGRVMGIDENKVVPDMKKSVYEGAIACWSGQKLRMWLERFLIDAPEYDFPIHRPYQDLSKSEKHLLWRGNHRVEGIDTFFKELESKSYKIQNRVLLARYRGRTICPECEGGRLRKEATYVKVGERSLPELASLSIEHLAEFFKTLKLDKHDQKIASRLLLEVQNRLDTMYDVGLGYLTLERISSTLSGGETQRINLTRLLGSNLTSSLYILDEPSIGLHPKDTERLVKVLYNLRDLGNTVVVVEHEEEIIQKTDYIIDIGPLAGIHGGEVVYAGPYQKFVSEKHQSLTNKYLRGDLTIPIPALRRKVVHKIEITGARQHNLKSIDVIFPLQSLCVVTGVSGSGKTTLVKHILYPLVKKHLEEYYTHAPGHYSSFSGDLSLITHVEMVDQNPIGRSSRSNPITYVKAYDTIRKLMSELPVSRIRGYKPKHFSFNVEGGRCETCKGDGEILVEMQFLADVKLICDECKGKRFKQEVLEVEYQSKNIFDILNLSIEEAISFFSDVKEIVKKIRPLYDVGLGYIKLGQSSSTLSGGEAQRVKLASFLGKEHDERRILFIFDEPTTGLHFHDINKLLDALNALIERGHSVIIIEHNIDVIKSADWVIDLGPDGGEYGGYLIAQDTPEFIASCAESYTGQFLKEKLS